SPAGDDAETRCTAELRHRRAGVAEPDQADTCAFRRPDELIVPHPLGLPPCEVGKSLMQAKNRRKNVLRHLRGTRSRTASRMPAWCMGSPSLLMRSASRVTCHSRVPASG